MNANGRVPESELVTVAVGVQLLATAANAYRALLAQGAHEHIAIKPAPGVGSGYRDIAIQEEFYKAAHCDKAAQRAVQLNGSSVIKVASPGYSSHGYGNRIDLLFDGSSNPTAVDLNLAKRFGFTREFGSLDPNHFEHDGKTATETPKPASPTHVDVPLSVTVVQGDTLTRIAEQHHLPLSVVERLNAWLNDPRPDGRRHGFDFIYPGDKIRIR